MILQNFLFSKTDLGIDVAVPRQRIAGTHVDASRKEEWQGRSGFEAGKADGHAI